MKDVGDGGRAGECLHEDVLLQLITGGSGGELGDQGGDTESRPRWNELLRTRALWQEGFRI